MTFDAFVTLDLQQRRLERARQYRDRARAIEQSANRANRLARLPFEPAHALDSLVRQQRAINHAQRGYVRMRSFYDMASDTLQGRRDFEFAKLGKGSDHLSDEHGLACCFICHEDIEVYEGATETPEGIAHAGCWDESERQVYEILASDRSQRVWGE